ncbi:MAG: hypothetical protein L6R40_007397 [Gallowayella cf. fulva]|nr:MAG: hypothetical protein L6R40_007397 [Xanthomendoza cf. fulva]
MAATPAEADWVTEVLVKNIHCASCISHIKEVLAHFGPAVSKSSISIISSTVRVWHSRSLSVRQLCDALTDAAFDIVFANTNNELGHLVDGVVFDDPHREDWLDAAFESCRPSTITKANESRSFTAASRLDREQRHSRYCATCRMEEIKGLGPGMMQLGSVKPRRKRRSGEKCYDGVAEALPQYTESQPGDRGQITNRPIAVADHTETQHVVTLMIQGMTCASCSGAITAAIQELEYVTKVDVSLLTNSAVVMFTGSAGKAEALVNVVEDVGFEASQRDLKPLAVSTSKSARDSHESIPRRSIMLRVDGMFCGHCPLRIVESLRAKYSDHLDIENSPSIESPIIGLIYTPIPGLLTVRDIISTIHGVHEQFVTHVYHPPSIENQSQVMQAQERKKLLIRLVLCSVVSIPTLLIGVVWMSLVPETNPTRKFFEHNAWGSTVTRAQWALCILASSVMFFASDVFHIRALKEIRALWRPKSQVPLLRRFYRFGSMNLLVSAGTSVAYFSSVGLLIKNGATNSKASSHSPQYFDAVVFLTLFILLGKFLGAYSKAKTGSAVAMLGKLRPREAVLVNPTLSSDDDQSGSIRRSFSLKDEGVSTSNTQTICTDLLEIGDVVVVPCGSSPPADGVIVTGSSRFNESSLTGEFRDVSKSEGDQVYAGTVNTSNPVQIEITGLGGTSMLDQIISVVREGQTKRAPVERVVDTVTAYFVPVITALAIITFVIWFALGTSGLLNPKYLDKQDGGWAFWSLEFAIAVFVVACPCGIGLAAPTALFVGGGLAAKSGILVRGGGEAFQEASNVDAVVFDKTGTLTEGGNPTVTDHEMLVEGDESKIAWSITRSIEETSSHPLARAILTLSSTQDSVEVATESITEEAGCGLRGTFTVKCNEDDSNDHISYQAAIGSEAFLNSLQKDLFNYFHTTTLSTWKSQSKSIALLGLRKISDPSTATTSDSPSWRLAAIFAISDPLRSCAIPTINVLQAHGIAVYMLTGDNPTTASAVASTLSIPADHVFAACLPTEKAAKIDWLKENAPLRTSPTVFSKILTEKREDPG